jgi:hypothetical protein
MALVCHPSTPADAVDWIDARVLRQRSGVLVITFHVVGSLSALRIPQPSAPRIADRLWEHTCFEVFVAAEGADAYHEFNLSPSGEWMAHAFRRRRDGGPLADYGLDPEIATHQHDWPFELTAILRLNRLSGDYSRGPLRLALSAVIEDLRGTLSYWALRHQPGKPDFHHPDAFALRLDALAMDAAGNPG